MVQAIKFSHLVLNGKTIAYHQHTQFWVQVGRGKRGSYKTRYSFTGDLHRAIMFYKMVNVGAGYKKRLYMPSCFKNPVLIKEMWVS